MNVFITGVSSGIGKALAAEYCSQGAQVFGISRRTPEDLIESSHFHFASCDLSDHTKVLAVIKELLSDVAQLDVVVLNAGMLGKIQDLTDTSVEELQAIMNVNVWSNKTVIDALFNSVKSIDQVIAISSGASVNGNRGWGGYSLSKAALNMLTMLYSHEHEETHFCAFAPGLVDTSMQDYLCSLETNDNYPSLARIQSTRGTEVMPTPDVFAKTAIEVFPKLKEYNSGSFIDIRKM